jgi:hypothetical protein
MKRGISIFVATAITVAGVWSFDYGLSVSTSPQYLYEDYSFTATASPWYSSLIGEKGELYLSGIAEAVYEEEEWDGRLDLGRFQATLRPRPGFRIDAGRVSYSDVSGFVAHGLFDGARFAYAFKSVNFQVGGFYTGFLNKERADISMSDADAEDAVDEDVYFAPSRALATVSMDVPSFIARMNASVEFVGQFDLRGREDVVHSQYLCFSLAGPVNTLVSFMSSLATGFAEAADLETSPSLAFRSELSVFPPGGLADRAYLGLKWASGDSGAIDSFLPVKGLNAGSVFNAGLSGIAAFKGGYFVRILEMLSADLSTTLFLREGGGVQDPELDAESDDSFLGAEMYGDVIFAPSSEFAFTGGAGVFIPSADAFISDARPRPMFAASLIVSF